MQGRQSDGFVRVAPRCHFGCARISAMCRMFRGCFAPVQVSGSAFLLLPLVETLEKLHQSWLFVPAPGGCLRSRDSQSPTRSGARSAAAGDESAPRPLRYARHTHRTSVLVRSTPKETVMPSPFYYRRVLQQLARLADAPNPPRVSSGPPPPWPTNSHPQTRASTSSINCSMPPTPSTSPATSSASYTTRPDQTDHDGPVACNRSEVTPLPEEEEAAAEDDDPL